MDNRPTSTLTETRTQPTTDDASNLTPTLKGAIVKSLFVLGSAMLIFESVRNSLTWYLARFWGGAGDVWQMLWEAFLVRVQTQMKSSLTLNREVSPYNQIK